MTAFTPAHLVDALSCTIDHAAVPPDRVVAGSPTEGCVTFDEFAGGEIGVWEMSPGVASDVEVDEVFVVIAGQAQLTIHPDGEGAASAPIDLTVGSLVRLTQGMRTTWAVTDTLRKVYFAGG